MIIVLTACLNGVYIYKLLLKTDPTAYLSGRIPRSEYIEKFQPEYPALDFANRHLPENTRLLAFFLGNRSYYSNHDIVFNHTQFKWIVKNAATAGDVLVSLKKNGNTDIIINYAQFNEWVDINFNTKEKQLIQQFMNRHTRLRFAKNGFGLYHLPFSKASPALSSL